MRSTNVVILVGKVGRDPKSGTTKNGHAWTNISLATTKLKKDGKIETTWHRIVAWNTASDAMQAFEKGDTVYVEGELENNEYMDNDGRRVSNFQVNAKCVMGINTSGIDDVQSSDDSADEEFSQEYGGF